MLIGLTGSKGVGKSTVALILCKKYKCSELAFANCLKEICSRIYNVPLDYFHDPLLKEKTIEKINTTPRKLMQIIGVKFRTVSDDIPELNVKNPWIYNVEENIKKNS